MKKNKKDITVRQSYVEERIREAERIHNFIHDTPEVAHPEVPKVTDLEVPKVAYPYK